MELKELIEKNPLRVLYAGDPDSCGAPRTGLVMARKGIGKTAILVQLALDSLLIGNQVLHVSIGQSLDKTRTWYDDMFRDIVGGAKLENEAEVYDRMNRNRLIMTFKAATFSRPKLEERLNDLVYQNIFRPNTLIIDGFEFGPESRQLLTDMRELMSAMDLSIWFSGVNHVEDNRTSALGVPAPCHEVDDLFDTIILLKPSATNKCIAMDIVKDTTPCKAEGKQLNLDPTTFLIKEKYDTNC